MEKKRKNGLGCRQIKIIFIKDYLGNEVDYKH